MYMQSSPMQCIGNHTTGRSTFRGFFFVSSRHKFVELLNLNLNRYQNTKKNVLNFISFRDPFDSVLAEFNRYDILFRQKN